LKKQITPLVITSLRVVALPFIIFSFMQQFHYVTYALFLFALSTDLLDGYVAKKLGATSKRGAYFDVVADFVFIIGMFLAFIVEEIYPPWILLFIITAFMQFILTSVYLKQTMYDPIGKYYGSLMYGGIGLTLLFPEQIVYDIVLIGIIASTIVALFSRLVFLLLAQNCK